MTGIETSRTTTSGFSSKVFFRAVRPLETAPTTSKDFCNNAVTALSIRATSSATTTRIRVMKITLTCTADLKKQPRTRGSGAVVHRVVLCLNSSPPGKQFSLTAPCKMDAGISNRESSFLSRLAYKEKPTSAWRIVRSGFGGGRPELIMTQGVPVEV